MRGNLAKSASRISESVDMDIYSTSIIEELLNSEQEWTDQNEIIKLTFRALTDLVQVHGETIKDLKSIMTTRASKQQLSTGLALKANALDISKVVEELSNAVESKISYFDINSILKEYAHKKDISHLAMLSSDRNPDSQRHNHQSELECKILQARMDDFQKEISRRLGGCATLSEFQELIQIVEQKVNISEMNEVLENRVTKQYLSTCLQKKVAKADLESLLSRKADTADLDYLVSGLEMKASLTTIEKLTQILENKADRSDLMLVANERKLSIQEQASAREQLDIKISEFKRELDETRNTLNQGLSSAATSLRNYMTSNEVHVLFTQTAKEQSEHLSLLNRKIDALERQSSNQLKYDSFKRELTSEINLRKRCEEKIYEEIDDVRRRLEETAAKTVQKIDFFSFKSEIAEELDHKIETQHVQEAFNKWEVELSQKMEEDKEEVYGLVQRVQKTLTEGLAVNASDVLSLSKNVGRKAERIDKGAAQEIVKKNRREIEECRKTVDLVYSELRTKIDLSEYEADLLELRKKFDVFEREISLKANIKDVCILADSKPNMEDVNRALKEIKTAIAEKTSEEDLQDIVKDQATINEALLCQNITGRWLWQSGETKSGSLIPWEVEFANTMPDYYFWQKDKTSILVLVGGFYEITACVFGRGSPALMINGESIGPRNDENVNTGNTNKRVAKRREKDTVGTKIQQFISLPARSRISVSVSCEGCEGFLNVQRL